MIFFTILGVVLLNIITYNVLINRNRKNNAKTIIFYILFEKKFLILIFL